MSAPSDRRHPRAAWPMPSGCGGCGGSGVLDHKNRHGGDQKQDDNRGKPHKVAVVAVGELDMASVEHVERAVTDLKDAGFESIVIDLSRIAFIDSRGLRTLIALRNHAKRDGHALTLVTPGAATSRIFDITGTRGLFEWRNRSGR